MCCDCVRVCTGDWGVGLRTGVATGVCVCVCVCVESTSVIIIRAEFPFNSSLWWKQTCSGCECRMGGFSVCVCVSGWIPLLWSGQRRQGTLGLSCCPYGSSSCGTEPHLNLHLFRVVSVSVVKHIYSPLQNTTVSVFRLDSDRVSAFKSCIQIISLQFKSFFPKILFLCFILLKVILKIIIIIII